MNNSKYVRKRFLTGINKLMDSVNNEDNQNLYNGKVYIKADGETVISTSVETKHNNNSYTAPNKKYIKSRLVAAVDRLINRKNFASLNLDVGFVELTHTTVETVYGRELFDIKTINVNVELSV